MMCPSNIVLWCFAFLLVSSSSKSQKNSTINEGNDNSTVRYHPFISFVENQSVDQTLCNSCENFMNNTIKMEDKSSINSTKNDREQNNQMSMESYANSTEISYSILQQTNENLTETQGKSNSTNMSNQLHENYIDDYNKTTIVPYEACKKITCIQLCCPFGKGLTLRGKCVPAEKNYNFPSIFTYGNNSQGKKLNERFPLTFHDPCAERKVGYWYNDPSGYLLFANGSLHQNFSNLVLSKFYCLALLVDFQNRYDVITCTEQAKLSIYMSACLLVSLPFLLLTFVVYSILPELQTMHGYTLRAHVASLFISYTIMYFGQQNGSELVESNFCIPLAYIFNFTFLSTFFWLNVTCFDIWWTFSGPRSHQNGKSRDKKRFIIYSLYAWGIAFIINIICAIMDIPGIPETYIRPEMCRKRFWLTENWARTLYFYVPVSFTIITNMCFFIITSITLLRQNKYISSQMSTSESKRHNENKQRFKMYLKLFVVMGVSWVIDGVTKLLSWTIGLNIAPEVWIFTTILIYLQGATFFIIFVCQKKIMKMFLKRYGGRSCPCSKIPTQCIVQ